MAGELQSNSMLNHLRARKACVFADHVMCRQEKTLPVHDLADMRDLLTAPIGAERRIGGKQNAFRKRDVAALRKARQRRYQEPFLAN